jgi:hypothetical protein
MGLRPQLRSGLLHYSIDEAGVHDFGLSTVNRIPQKPPPRVGGGVNSAAFRIQIVGVELPLTGRELNDSLTRFRRRRSIIDEIAADDQCPSLLPRHSDADGFLRRD